MTYEELKERLHKRIEMLRAKRHADQAASTAKVAKEWQNQKKNDSLKRNRKSKALDPEAAEGETPVPPAKRAKLDAKEVSDHFDPFVISRPANTLVDFPIFAESGYLIPA